MKKLLFALLLVSGIASAQYTPTGSKTRFVNGIGLGTKSDAAFGTVDSLVLYTKLDSTLMFKYKGTARALMYAANVGAQIHDSLYAVYQLKAGTSAGARLVSNSGTVVAEWGLGGSANMDFHGFAGYDANRSASYTARSFTDKNYVDSGITTIKSKTGILWGNGTTVNGSLYTFANDSVITYRGVPFLQNVSTTQSPEVYSLFLGYGSGEKFKLGTKGYANTGIGLYSLSKIQTNTTSEASSNTATGYYSGAELTVGIANTINGTAALSNADSIFKAVSIGWHNMLSAERGDETVSVGANSLILNKAQSPHTTIGTNILVANQFGQNHTLGGYYAGQSNVNGNRLTGWGRLIFADNVSGSDNTGIGDSTGSGLVTGSGNLFLGNRINVGDVSNHIVLAKGDGTIRAMHNDILWNFYDSVKASAFKSTGGIVTGATSYIKGNSLSAVFSSTGASNYNSLQFLGGTSGTAYNWEISKDNSVANTFEIAASTSVGGTSFAASIFRLKQNGELTLTALGTGTVQATSGVLSVISDGRLKNKLGYYSNALEAITKLGKPQYWKYSAKSKLPKEAQKVKQFGLMADNVHKVLGEEFAPTQKNGYYGLSDRALLGLAIQAIQELKAEIEQLKKK